MEIYFEKSFEKDLKKIKDKNLLEKVKRIIEKIENAKTLESIGNLARIRRHKRYYRIRIGDYRLGVEVIEKKVIFVRFLHRKEIYRYFS